MDPKQIDCFKINIIFFKFLGIWPPDSFSHRYKYYAIIFITCFVIIYDILLSINLCFLPRQINNFVEELILYFTELNILSKVLTFLYMHGRLEDILDVLECDIFQPENKQAFIIIQDAKSAIKRYWKISAVICYTCNFAHVVLPLFAHIFLSIELALPVSGYDFIPENIKKIIVYPLYLYQSIGIHFHMLYTIHIDGFFLGLIIYITAQLEVLDLNLRCLTDQGNPASDNRETVSEREYAFKLELDKCIVHFDHISKFCSLVEKVFSIPLFVQFSMSSCIICVCLFRFTSPAPPSYYIFLVTYMTAMTLQILLPCWFGSRIMEKSSMLSVAAYHCDWIERPGQFKSNLRLFIVRMNKPLTLSGMKMFRLSLTAFTSIMNTAYSFFTLLRHMQTQDISII